MLTHALDPKAAADQAAPLDLTALARRAGLPHPTFVSPRLAARYALTPDTPCDQRPDLYDLVWATNLALNRLLAARHRHHGGDDYYDFEFWSYLRGDSDPVPLAITAIVVAAGTAESTLRLMLTGEVPEPRRPHVLLVDDDANVARCLGLGLEREGFDVTLAGNATEAWTWLQQQQPDVVLSDVDMPGLSGLELGRRLKADPRTATLPVVFCTGNYDAREPALRLGAADFLEKPVGLGELARRLRRALSAPPTAKTTVMQKP